MMILTQRDNFVKSLGENLTIRTTLTVPEIKCKNWACLMSSVNVELAMYIPHIAL